MVKSSSDAIKFAPSNPTNLANSSLQCGDQLIHRSSAHGSDIIIILFKIFPYRLFRGLEHLYSQPFVGVGDDDRTAFGIQGMNVATKE
jgi:hypothetical protein